MAGNDGFLYPVPSDVNPNDGRLRDPTVEASTDVTGTGTLTSAAAEISGVGISSSSGTGIFLAQAASIVGIGEVTDTGVTGQGAIAAQAAQVSGTGLSASSGTGTLTAQAAELTGVGIGESSGAGTLTAQDAAILGVGITQWVARSQPYLDENGVDHYRIEDGTGNYAREEVALAAGESQISGIGFVSIVATDQPRGTVGWLYGKYAPGDRRRTSTDVLRDRERFGIPPAASAVISAVAHRQADSLQTDAQKRFEELSRELELRGIEWRAEYLEELNTRLERLITAEIAARLKLMQQAKDEEAMLMLLAVIV